MGANRQSSVRRAQNRIDFSGYFSISLFLKPEHVFLQTTGVQMCLMYSKRCHFVIKKFCALWPTERCTMDIRFADPHTPTHRRRPK